MQKGNETSSKSSNEISFLELVIVNSSFSVFLSVKFAFRLQAIKLAVSSKNKTIFFIFLFF